MIKFNESPNIAWDPVATSTPNFKAFNAFGGNHLVGPSIPKSTDLFKALMSCRNDPSNISKSKTDKRKGEKTKKVQKSRSKFFDSPSSDDSEEEKSSRPRCNIKIENVKMSKSGLKNRSIKTEPEKVAVTNQNFVTNTRLGDKNKREGKEIFSNCEVINVDKPLNTGENEIIQGNIENKKSMEAVVDNKKNPEIFLSSVKSSSRENNVKDTKNELQSITKINKEPVKRTKKSVLKDLNNGTKNYTNQNPKTNDLNSRNSQLSDIQKSTKLQKKVRCIRNKTKENNKVKNKSNVSNPNLELDKTKNSSHQLFSESLKQELIDSLDLTKLEPDEEKLKVNCNDSKTSSVTKKNSKIKPKISEPNRRSGRTKKPVKEFWLPDNSQSINSQNVESVISSESKRQAIVATKHEPANENNIKKVSSEIKRKRSKGEVIASEKDTELVSKKKGKFVSEEKNSVSSKKKEKVDKRIVAKKVEKICEPSKAVEEDLVTPDSTTPDFFKLLDHLPLATENPSEFFTTECWSLRNFKCGVFKVGPLSEISYETTYPNSYFGGVLIQGQLRMKIGNQELELKAGDMAFVPPLTNWSAHNTFESESVFYYWSGRLKA